MDERWTRALQAKGINIEKDVQHDSSDKARTEKSRRSKVVASKSKSRQTTTNTVSRAMPFKATGHKGGISRQNNG